ncbi:hypothetical protein MUP95_08805 [bacterium]|nr:hypothetical protein [bacterium]
MKFRVIYYFVLLFVSAGLIFSKSLFAQTGYQDTTQQSNQNQAVEPQDSTGGEMVLEVIEIRGKIEKPSVIIVPKRVEPEIGEIELERSFQQEVKGETGQIPEPEKELQQVDRIESMKKTIQKERE